MTTEKLQGEYITFKDGEYLIPDNPIVGALAGDGIGPDIWNATRMVLDAAVEKAYAGKKTICWQLLAAGAAAFAGLAVFCCLAPASGFCNWDSSASRTKLQW